MKKVMMAVALGAVALHSSIAFAADKAPVAGASVATIKTDVVAVERGWRVSKLMSADVKNDKNETIGSIADAIITPSDQVTYAIVGVGGFLGLGEKHVAVPISLFKVDAKSNVTLPGATKKALEGMPEFMYAK